MEPVLWEMVYAGPWEMCRAPGGRTVAYCQRAGRVGTPPVAHRSFGMRRFWRLLSLVPIALADPAAAVSGAVRLVTPIMLTSSIGVGPLVPAFGILELHFVPKRGGLQRVDVLHAVDVVHVGSDPEEAEPPGQRA